jgi:hypothetical protein
VQSVVKETPKKRAAVLSPKPAARSTPAKPAAKPTAEEEAAAYSFPAEFCAKASETSAYSFPETLSFPSAQPAFSFTSQADAGSGFAALFAKAPTPAPTPVKPTVELKLLVPRPAEQEAFHTPRNAQDTPRRAPPPVPAHVRASVSSSVSSSGTPLKNVSATRRANYATEKKAFAFSFKPFTPTKPANDDKEEGTVKRASLSFAAPATPSKYGGFSYFGGNTPRKSLLSTGDDENM